MNFKLWLLSQCANSILLGTQIVLSIFIIGVAFILFYRSYLQPHELNMLTKVFSKSTGIVEVRSESRAGRRGEAQGSFVILSSTGDALTAGHLFDGFDGGGSSSNTFEINVTIGSSSTSEHASLIIIDPQLDIALIKLPGSGYIPASHANGSLEVGSTVKVLGYPSGILTVETSVITSTWGAPNGSLALSGIASAGAAGSAIIDDGGKVAGIIATPPHGSQQRIGLPIGVIRPLIQKAGVNM